MHFCSMLCCVREECRFTSSKTLSQSPGFGGREHQSDLMLSIKIKSVAKMLAGRSRRVVFPGFPDEEPFFYQHTSRSIVSTSGMYLDKRSLKNFPIASPKHRTALPSRDRLF